MSHLVSLAFFFLSAVFLGIAYLFFWVADRSIPQPPVYDHDGIGDRDTDNTMGFFGVMEVFVVLRVVAVVLVVLGGIVYLLGY